MAEHRDPWRWIASMPSTNLRILCSMVMALGTGARVIALGWEPNYEWLGFLVLWAGLDITQFGVKRTTDASYQASKTAQASSDATVARSEAATAKSEEATARIDAAASP